ncbi:hypothetical protein WJX77_006337 [Trebouxia sp. C0004]
MHETQLEQVLLSALAAEMEGYQLLKDNQSLSQGGLLPQCQNCQKSGCWVTQHGCTLVSWASDQTVSVYHCKFSDRCCNGHLSYQELSMTRGTHSSHAQVVALPEPEARRLLEELATGRLPIGSYHELHALCDKVNSQLGLLLSDICVASGRVIAHAPKDSQRWFTTR